MRHLLFPLFLLTPIVSFSQDYEAQFDSICNEGDISDAIPVLKDWEQDDPDDPEMYIAFFNYYLNESRDEVVAMDNKPGKGQNLEIQDTGTGKPVGYMHSKVVYADSAFELAQSYLKEGIRKHPKRLDMRFGRIYSLREKGALEEHVEEILEVIDLHQKFKDEWLWHEGQPREDAEEFFKGAIQDYQYELFNLKKPYTTGIEQIASKMLKYYPEDKRNLTNLGVCKVIQGEYKEAIIQFLKAENIDPDDTLILGNIAYSYLQIDNLKKAKEYYQKVAKKGNPQEVEKAKYQLEQIERELGE